MRLTHAFGLAFTQSEVDFVIPDLAVDLPLAIDPFLLYKSRDATLRGLHSQLLSLFQQGIQLFRGGDRAGLDQLIDFPEVDEIGFGYSEGTIGGRGLGAQLNHLLAQTLAASPMLQERGLRHVEELQLVSIGVGPDRVSDIAGNVLKSYLIDYTQRQAQLWRIPLTTGMPVNHYFDFDDWEWTDGHFDLPRNPVSGLPILLVPRRVVRLLPWINYDDYVRTDFRMYLKPSKGPRLPQHPGMTNAKRTGLAKKEVIEITRDRLELLDQYVTRKERERGGAEPALGQDAVSQQAEVEVGERFIGRLQLLPSGRQAAEQYQRLVWEILNYLFEPNLTDGRMEEKTHLGTERRDIIYANEAERSFLKYVRETYLSLFLLFEIKNTAAVELEHINQVATYLGAHLGMLGFIITRHPPGENLIRKTYAVYNNTPGMPRKTILILTDDDLTAMIRMRQEAQNPVRWLQDHYRQFRISVQ